MMVRLGPHNREQWPQVIDQYLEELRANGQQLSALVEHQLRQYGHQARRFEKWKQEWEKRNGRPLDEEDRFALTHPEFAGDQIDREFETARENFDSLRSDEQGKSNATPKDKIVD